MKLIEVTLEEYDAFKLWYMDYAKRTQNIRKLRLKFGIETIYIKDKLTKETVCFESHSYGESKYRISPKWYELYKNEEIIL